MSGIVFSGIDGRFWEHCTCIAIGTTFGQDKSLVLRSEYDSC
jgi:hypothetical protein